MCTYICMPFHIHACVYIYYKLMHTYKHIPLFIHTIGEFSIITHLLSTQTLHAHTYTHLLCTYTKHISMPIHMTIWIYPYSPTV